jgi:hypothetical protein
MVRVTGKKIDSKAAGCRLAALSEVRTGSAVGWPEKTQQRPDSARSKAGMQALGRMKTGDMNKTEQAYEKLLKEWQQAGIVAWYKFEGVKLRLADNTFYSPDFAVMLTSGNLEMHEVKGFWQDDARAKIKIAADIYPFRFIAVKPKAKKDGGGWEVEEF